MYFGEEKKEATNIDVFKSIVRCLGNIDTALSNKEVDDQTKQELITTIRELDSFVWTMDGDDLNRSMLLCWVLEGVSRIMDLLLYSLNDSLFYFNPAAKSKFQNGIKEIRECFLGENKEDLFSVIGYHISVLQEEHGSTNIVGRNTNDS